MPTQSSISIWEAYAITIGWGVVAFAILAMGVFGLYMWDRLTPNIKEWEEIKKNNTAVALVMSAVIIAFAIIVAAAIGI